MGSLEKLSEIKSALKGEGVELVAVSKTRSHDEIMTLYNAGQRIFGENRVQEMCAKAIDLPKDIQWHQIGHLQRNKVKQIVPFVSMIHSVDSIRLLNTVQNEAEKAGKVIHCLLQVHVALEETKFGFSVEEIDELINSLRKENYPHIAFDGVMGMASNVADKARVRKDFKSIKALFLKLKEGLFKDDTGFQHISMGMSGDYELAMEEGSTMVRIGSLLFSN